MKIIDTILKVYDSESFVAKLKARFLLFSYTIVLWAIILAVFYTIYGNLNNPMLDYSINYEIFSLYLLAFAVLSFGFLIFIRGHFAFSAHLLLVCGLALVWATIFTNKTLLLPRLDSIVLAIGLLSMLPLIITKRASVMLLYAGANILALYVFIYLFHNELELPKISIISYLSDNTVAILGVTLIAYAVFTINKLALNKAELDFNERTKAEVALKNSELFKIRVFDSSKTPIVVMDSTTFKYVESNQAAIDMYGYTSREDLLNKTPLDVSSELQYDGTPSSIKAFAYIKKALTDGSVIFEWKHQRPNGEFWDAEVHLLSFTAQEQSLLQFSLIDITERKRAEMALSQSEEKYKKLMENINEVIMMVDNDDRVLFVNKRFTEKLGYTADEIIGKIGYQVLIPTEHQSSIKAFNNKRTQNETSQYEMPFIAKDGTIVDFLVSGAPIADGDGQIIGSIGAMIDITENIKNRREISDSQKMFRDVLDTIPVRVFWKDLQGNYMGANKLFVEDAGKKNEHELIGCTDFEMSWREQAELYRNDDKMVIETQIPKINYEEPQTDDSGKESWLSTSKIPLRNSNGVIYGILGIYEDITARKETQIELDNYRNNLEILVKERTDELATTNEELTTINEELFNQKEELQVTLDKLNDTQSQLIQSEKMASLGVLTAGIAHEINNPLNFIQGGSLALEDYVKQNLNDHTEQIYPLLNAINTGVNRAADIVISLSHYSREDDSQKFNCR